MDRWNGPYMGSWLCGDHCEPLYLSFQPSSCPVNKRSISSCQISNSSSRTDGSFWTAEHQRTIWIASILWKFWSLLIVISDKHKNLGRTPGWSDPSTVLMENVFFLFEKFILLIILIWLQMYRWRSTLEFQISAYRCVFILIFLPAYAHLIWVYALNLIWVWRQPTRWIWSWTSPWRWLLKFWRHPHQTV